MKILDAVRLREDLPSEGLRKGDVGTVVMLHGESPPEAYEVEFTDQRGMTVAQLVLRDEQVELLLQHGQAGNSEAH